MREQPPLTIPLTAGMDERTSPIRLAPPKMSRVENARYDERRGALTKCPAGSELTSVSFEGSDVGAVFRGREAVRFHSYDTPSVHKFGVDAEPKLQPDSASVGSDENQHCYYPVDVVSTRQVINGPYTKHAIGAVGGAYPTVLTALVVFTSSTTVELRATSYRPGGDTYLNDVVITDSAAGLPVPFPYVYGILNSGPKIVPLSGSRLALCYMRSSIVRLRVLDGQTMTFGGEIDIANVSSNPEFTVTSTGLDSVVFMAAVNANDTSRDVRAINVDTLARATNIAAGAFSGASSPVLASTARVLDNGSTWLAVTYTGFSSGSNAPVRLIYLEYDDSGATSFSSATSVAMSDEDEYRALAVSYLNAHGKDQWVVAGTVYDKAGTAQRRAYTRFWWADTDDNGAEFDQTLEWMVLRGEGAIMELESGDARPVFPMGPYLGGATQGDEHYVDDNRFCIVSVGPQRTADESENWGFDLLASLGKDRYSPILQFDFSSSAIAFVEGIYPQAGVFTDRRDALFCSHQWYLDGDSVVVSELDMAPGRYSTGQSSRPHVEAPSETIIAAAAPVAYDGDAIAEQSQNFRPHVLGTTSGGTGPNLTGTFNFRAVVTWRDAAGDIHRSAPSLPLELVLSSDNPRLWVPNMMSYRNGGALHNPTVELYMTEAGGSTFQKLTTSDNRGLLPASYDNEGCQYFTSIDNRFNSQAPFLYSTGGLNQEVFPSAPPPLWHVAAVGYRLWGVNAEDRQSAHFTKYKSEGVSYEWGEGFVLRMSADAGSIMAIANLDGRPLFLCERGIYTVDGQGPSNTGQGQFGTPRRISTLRCVSRAAASTTGGVFFMTPRGAAVYDGQGPRLLDEAMFIDGSTPRPDLVSSISENPVTGEVYFWRGTGTDAYVYNYLAQAWSVWNGTIRCSESTALPDGTLLTGSRKEESGRDAVSMALQSGWIAPAGPQTRCSFRDVVLHCESGADAHGVDVQLQTDYDEDFNTTNDFSADSASVTSETRGRQYTLRTVPTVSESSAIRFLIEGEVGADGMRPMTVTINWATDGKLQRRYATLTE